MTTATLTPVSTVRAATTADVPQIVEMGLRFAGAEYADILPADPVCLATLAQRLLEAPDAVVFVAEPQPGQLTGLIALMTYVQPMTGETIATEIAWWMNPSARGSRDGLRLLRAGEAWARTHGAQKLQMIAPTDHVGAFYERIGFRRTEIHYMRAL